jgi:hypothetical protein
VETFATYRLNNNQIEYSLDWIIGPSLDGTRYNVVMRQPEVQCPLGLKGGFNLNDTLDETLSIECLDNQKSPDCCLKVAVSATGKMRSIQGARFGTYERKGVLNNRPIYFFTQNGYDSYLFFLMNGKALFYYKCSQNKL